MSTAEAVEPSYAQGEQADAATLKSIVPDTVVRIDPTLVSVETGFNARDFSTPANKDNVAILAKNIATNGVQTPLRVRIVGKRIVLVDGETRLRALSLARAAHGSNGSIPEALKTVPVLLEPEADNEVHRTLSLVTKNMNNPLAPLETYAVVKRLEALGVSRQNIGTTLGLSRTYISNLGMLDNATDTVIELIRKGKATANLVIDMVRENKSAVAADELPTLIERAIVASAAKQEKEAARAAAAGKTISKKAKRKDTQQVIYTRETFKSLITVCQDLFAEMTPASEYKKWRGWIRNTLESMNAPLEREDATEESDEE